MMIQQITQRLNEVNMLLDPVCDAKKAEYDTAHAQTAQLYKEWQQERDRTFCVYCFKPRERNRQCAEEFLQRCGISKSYYDKHHNDVCSKGTTKEKQEYCKSIDNAIENARKLKCAP